MRRTYLDANVLIAAYRAEEPHARLLMQVLDDPEREWVISDFLILEGLPKPIFHRRILERNFMQSLLKKAAVRVAASPKVTKKAIYFASRYNVSPRDALHLGAAWAAKVDEFLTLERPTTKDLLPPYVKSKRSLYGVCILPWDGKYSLSLKRKEFQLRWTFMRY